MKDLNLSRYSPPALVVEKPHSKKWRHLWWGLGLGLVVGLIAGYAVFNDQTAYAPERDKNNVIGKSKMAAVEGSIILDSQVSGSTVFVRTAKNNVPAWITVRDNNGGTPGNILGAQYLKAGEHEDFEIELQRALEMGRSYLVLFHNDDGDRIFDHKKDLPAKDASGKISYTKFEVGVGGSRGD